MPDLNKMTLEEVIAYCDSMERNHTNWLMHLFVGTEGFENAVRILSENGKI